MSILTSVALGWLGRRVVTGGGWLLSVLGALLAFYANLTPAAQQLIQQVASGHWQDITLGSAAGIVVLAFGQWKSFKATVRPQIVTPEGQKVELEKLPPAAQVNAVVAAQAAPRKRTLADYLAEKLAKR